MISEFKAVRRSHGIITFTFLIAVVLWQIPACPAAEEILAIEAGSSSVVVVSEAPASSTNEQHAHGQPQNKEQQEAQKNKNKKGEEDKKAVESGLFDSRMANTCLAVNGGVIMCHKGGRAAAVAAV